MSRSWLARARSMWGDAVGRGDAETRLRGALTLRDDGAFDAYYGGRADELGYHYWTPIGVATRVAHLLRRLGSRRVLDVGAGPGKFCVAAAATCPTMTFTGVEQREELVTLASAAARNLGLGNVELVHGDVFDVDWESYDALYFFNPFGENLYVHPGDRFDDKVELSGARFIREIRRAEAALEGLREGTILVTYHGFGGAIPGSFDLLKEEPFGIRALRVWIKTARYNPRSECWRELSLGGVRRGRFFGI
jgi:SAM-dependent methyltransferase